MNNNGTLNNYGVFRGDGGAFSGTYTDSGTLSPGGENDSIGVLTFFGDLTKETGSTEIQLAGLFDGGGQRKDTLFDWFEVSGDVSLSGTLDVEVWGGFEFADRDYFRVIRVGGTLSGQFDGLGEGGLVGEYEGENLFITYAGGDGNDVVLYVNSIPEPNSTTLLILLAGLGMTVRRRL